MSTTTQVVGTAWDSVIRPFDRVNVYVRRRWADSWTLSPWCEALNASEGLGASGSATILFRYGLIVYPEIGDWATYWPDYLLDWFVQLRGVTNQGYERELFTGIIIGDALDAWGSDATVATGDQVLQAVPLWHLLAQRTVRQAKVKQSNNDIDTIGHVPPVNYRTVSEIGLVGNRSTTSASDGHYRYSENGAVWSHADYIDTVLYDFASTNAIDPLEIDFYLGGQSTELAKLHTSQNVDGLTVLQILDLFVDRRRGFAWRVGSAGFKAGGNIDIEVMAVFDEPISVGDVTLQPNPVRMDFFADETQDIDSMQLQLTSGVTYGRVRVRGERIVSCFSVDSDTFTKGWTTAEQTAYKEAAGSSDWKVNDSFRADDRFTRVFRAIVMNSSFDWRAKINDQWWTINVGVTNTGDVDNSTVKCSPAAQPKYWSSDKAFLRRLPLLEGHEDEASAVSPTDRNPSGTVAQLMPPRVWGKVQGK